MARPSSIPSDTIPWGAQNVDVSSEDAEFSPPIRGFQLAVGGSVKVDFADGCPPGFETGIYPACIAGVRYEGYIKKIYKTGTTTEARANILVFV